MRPNIQDRRRLLVIKHPNTPLQIEYQSINARQKAIQSLQVDWKSIKIKLAQTYSVCFSVFQALSILLYDLEGKWSNQTKLLKTSK